MTRAVTDGEKAKLRSGGQWSQLGLAVWKPSVIYSARVNQVIDSTDGMIQITYDQGSGTLADVLEGMTLWIGSSAGAYDKGMARIRQAPISTVIFIGETSELEIADDDYLTIVNLFGLWAKHPTIAGTVAYMDATIAYSNQHSVKDPVVRMGPILEVLELTGATASSQRTAETSTILGEAVNGWSWSAPGASATANLTTATPTITYNAAGDYVVHCTYTTAAGASHTEHRYCKVWDKTHPLISRFTLGDIRGEKDTGGWSYSVELWAGASMAEIHDRALAAVVGVGEHYGTDKISLGPVAGYENILCVGWIAGESIRQHWSRKSVTFTVQGPGWWMDRVCEFTTGVEITSSGSDPTAWTNMKNLTVDLGLWHLLRWRSTAADILDIWLTGDTKLAPSLEGAAGSLWSQIGAFASDSIQAAPCCNRYGQLFVEVDSQLLPASERSGIPVVQTLEKVDWQGEIEYEREIVGSCSMLEISGVSYDGTTATPIFSRAPGNTYGRFGRPDSVDNLLFGDQAQANALAGAMYAARNNEWPLIPVQLAGNHRFFDVCPRQYAQMSVAAADTIRGFVWTKRLIPRTITIKWSAKSGKLNMTVDFEGETIPKTGVTVTPPATPTYTYPTGGGGGSDYPITPTVTLPVIDLPDWSIPDAGLPGLACRTNDGYAGNGPFKLWPGQSAIVSGLYTSGMLASWVRRKTATYKSYVLIDALWETGESTSGPWGAQADNVIPCRVVANNGLGVDLEASAYSWVLDPATHGGHGILKAEFQPTSGFNTSYYYLYMDNPTWISDTLEIDGVTASIFNAGSSLAAFYQLQNRKMFYTNPPGGLSSTYFSNSNGHAAFKVVNKSNRGQGKINIYYTSTQLNANDGEFPTHSNGNLVVHPNTLYQPSIGEMGLNFWFEGTDVVTGSGSLIRTSNPWNIGTEYLTVEEGPHNIQGMAHVNYKNGWSWEITKIGWQPYSGGSYGTEEVLFGNGSGFRRVQIQDMSVYNVCAKE
jgi:hypothetical protein